ncbi:hypothetical protein ACHAWC_010174, partial [Mediolabrus comicus]
MNKCHCKAVLGQGGILRIDCSGVDGKVCPTSEFVCTNCWNSDGCFICDDCLEEAAGSSDDDDDEDAVEDITARFPSLGNDDKEDDEEEEEEEEKELESGDEDIIDGAATVENVDDKEDDDDDEEQEEEEELEDDDGGGKQKADRGEVEVRDDASSDDDDDAGADDVSVVPIQLPSIPPGFIPLDDEPLGAPTPPAIAGIVLDENGLKSFTFDGTKYQRSSGRGSRGGWGDDGKKMESFIINGLGLSGMNRSVSLQVKKDIISRAKESWEDVINNPSNPLKDPFGLYFHFGHAKVGDKLRPWLEHRDSKDEVITLLRQYVDLRIETMRSYLPQNAEVLKRWLRIQRILKQWSETPKQDLQDLEGMDNNDKQTISAYRTYFCHELYGKPNNWTRYVPATTEQLIILSSIPGNPLDDDYRNFATIVHGYQKALASAGLEKGMLSFFDPQHKETMDLLYKFLLSHQEIAKWKVDYLRDELGINFDTPVMDLVKEEREEALSKKKLQQMLGLLEEWQNMYPNDDVPYHRVLGGIQKLKKFIPLSKWLYTLKLRCREVLLASQDRATLSDEDMKKFHEMPEDRRTFSDRENQAIAAIENTGYDLDAHKNYRKTKDRPETKWLVRIVSEWPSAGLGTVSSWDNPYEKGCKKRPDMMSYPSVRLRDGTILTVFNDFEIDEGSHFFYGVAYQQHWEEWIVGCGKKSKLDIIIIERVNISFRKDVNDEQFKGVTKNKKIVMKWITENYEEEIKRVGGGPLVYMVHYDFPVDHHHIKASVESRRYHKVFASRSLIVSVIHLLNGKCHASNDCYTLNWHAFLFVSFLTCFYFIVLRDMNENRLEDDHLNQMVNYIGKSCAEVDSVYVTMETLFKVMRSANEAFFAGDLNLAYNVTKDSLRLFSRLKNKKAMAVCSNNLGILCLTIYRTMVVNEKEHFGDMTMADIASEGSAYFTVAIKLGEEQYEQFYEEQGWSEECLQFMQGLANRYFNRALLLLSTKEHAKSPKEFEASGFRDIQITADMDLEIVDQCIEFGFAIDRVERHNLMLSRSRGVEALVKLGYSPDDLFVDDIIAELLTDFRRALNNPGDGFFLDVSPAGRMQILDSELMKYCRRVKKDDVLAAKVAIRCLVEDEYILLNTIQKALKTMLVYVKDGGDSIMINGERKRILKSLISYTKKLDEEFTLRASLRNSGQSNALHSDIFLKSITAS